MKLLSIGVLGVAASVLITGCGGGNAAAVKSALTATLATTTGTDSTTTGSGLD